VNAVEENGVRFPIGRLYEVKPKDPGAPPPASRDTDPAG